MPNQPAKDSPSALASAAFGQLLQDAPALKGRLHEIANALLDKVLWDIEHGDPATVASHMRSFLPLLAREAASNEGDERMREVERQVAELRVGFGEQFASARPETTAPTVAEDAPPPTSTT